MSDRYLVMFGDLTDATSPGWSRIRKKDGTEMIGVKLKPTTYTIWKYKIKNSDYSEDGYIHKEYDIIHKGIDENDERGATLFLLCDFYGNPTVFEDRIAYELREQVKQWRTAFKSQLKKAARLEFELRTSNEQLEEREELENRRLQSKKKLLGGGGETIIQQQAGPEQVY